MNITLVATLTVVIIIAVAVFCANLITGQSLDNQKYLFTAKAAASDYAVYISNILWDICDTKTSTEGRGELLYALIQAQIEADQVISDYDIAGLEDYQALHAGLQSLCRDDIKAIERIRIKDAIYNDMTHFRELQRNYICIRAVTITCGWLKRSHRS